MKRTNLLIHFTDHEFLPDHCQSSNSDNGLTLATSRLLKSTFVKAKLAVILFFLLVGSITVSAQNKIPNSTFDTDITGWTYSGSGGNANSWDATNKQLKAHVATPGASYTSYQFYYYPSTSFFIAGESYILKFDAYGSTANHSVDVACGYNGGSYTNFISSASRYVGISTTKTTYTINFTAPSTFESTNFRVGFRIGGSAGNIAQDVYFDNIILTQVLPPPSPETYSIITEDASIIFGTNVNYQSNNALGVTMSTSNTYEGSKSILFHYDNLAPDPTWAMASVQPTGGTVNISGYANGYYNFAMKSSTNKSFYIRMKGGGQTALISFTQGADPYGFVRDGEWHFLSIPIAAFKANNAALNLSSVTDLMVVRSNAALVSTDNFDVEIDNFYLSLSFPALPPVILPHAWINEIHYDNVGTDVNEFVEVVIKNASLYNLSTYRVDLYNSADGKTYATKTLDQFVQGNTVGNYTFFTWSYEGIQEDAGDGLSLTYDGNLIQFLSYEGTCTATDGPAVGSLSKNIGASEPCSDAMLGEDYSLQLTGTGLWYSHFTWIDPPSTPGTVNVDNNGVLQAFANPPSVPFNWRYMLLVFIAIASTAVFSQYRATKRKQAER